MDSTMDTLWLSYGTSMDILWLSYDTSMGHTLVTITCLFAIYRSNDETMVSTAMSAYGES